ncbi:hypothetical protein BBJ28_00019634 [Nothophytophthora sp. Chile5]|nr:hypothetical protein BBJ28_00019634 [Nothophytophthora sp. Chile5]
MEAQRLLACLQWLCRNRPLSTLRAVGDSNLIIGQALMQSKCRALHLRPFVAAIRSLGAVMPLIYLRHVRRPLTISTVDATILDALIAAPHLGITGTLRIFRGQTPADGRPNKALPHGFNPAGRQGVRPLPDNYVGAEHGATIVTDKLLADYYKGRCLIATTCTLQRNPGYHSSSFTLVSKNDQSLHLDGRIIHDLSAPPGGSINDQTNSDASPDATWDLFESIAQRILDLSRRFPGHAIYAIVEDIADAFHHVPPSVTTGARVLRIVLGYSEPFWAFQWVDDIVLVEVDMGDRLQKAEQRLRDGVKLVFCSDGWHEGKFTTWSRKSHAVGIDWNIPDEIITVPQRKVEKMGKILTEASSRKFVSMKKLDSLVGILRHVISFIPITKPFIQRFVAVQTACRRHHKAGVSMSAFLQKDMHWWRDLVFQNEFAGVPMEQFDRKPHIDDVWLLQGHQQGLRMTAMVLRERVEIAQSDAPVNDTLVARILTTATEAWGLIAQGYKRANSHVNWKQPVTTPMLLKMRRQLNLAKERDGLLWGSIVFAYFFLDRSPELWGRVSLDRSTGTTRTHCVKAHNVILRNESGNQVDASASEAHSVEILFESHKGDRIAQGTTVRHYRPEHSALCPVVAAQQCLRIRAKWIAEKVALGPYLTSVSRTSTIKKNVVAKLIKDAARRMALSTKDFSCHSLRIGGACALLAAGKSDLVIRLMGRWSSW